MPVPEANFFGIVIAIQQKSGGKPVRGPGQPSKVLRRSQENGGEDSGQCRWKPRRPGGAGIKSVHCRLSMMLLVYLSTPDYIALLWTIRPVN